MHQNNGPATHTTYLFAGSWRKTLTDPNGPGGITVFAQDPSSGALKNLHHGHNDLAVGAMVVSAKNLTLYAVDETKHSPGQIGGTIHAFSIDPSTGALDRVGATPSIGSHPCSLSLDQQEEYLAVANYGSEDSILRSEQGPEGSHRVVTLHDEGNVALLPLTGGAISAASSVVAHTRAAGVDPVWQTAPHPHAVGFNPQGTHAVVCDRGGDSVTVYGLDRDSGKLLPQGEHQASPGWGPRSIAFSPDLPYFFVSSELVAEVAAFRLDVDSGTCQLIGTAPTEPEAFAPSDPADFFSRTHPSALAVHPGGRHVYVLNRGHNSIARLTIDPESGALTFARTTPTEGEGPWDLAFSNDGRFLYVANQGSGKIVVFAVDPDTGALNPTGAVAYAPRLASLCFLTIP